MVWLVPQTLSQNHFLCTFVCLCCFIMCRSRKYPYSPIERKRISWRVGGESRSQISCGRSRRRDLAKSNLHYVITCQEYDRGGKCLWYAQHNFVKADFVAYNKLMTGLRHDDSLESQNFVAFTKANKHKIRLKGFFYNLAGFFRILLRQSENFSDFYKVLSQFAFRNMIVPFYTSSSARALKLPSISHTSFLT